MSELSTLTPTPMRKLLVTGAAGFIGARIWARLAQAGHEVVAVDAMLGAAHRDGAQPPPQCRGNRSAPLIQTSAVAPTG